MKIRWVMAIVGALALALLTLPADPWPSFDQVAVAIGLARAAGSACPANAKPANLNFTLKDLNNTDVKLSSFKGKVILLDFWATWCAPCRIEIPGFIELYNKYRSRDFVVLGVSMDETSSPVKPFVQKLKMNYPVLIGTGREDIEQAFELTGLPTSFIISRDGKICGQHTGFAPKEQFEREIKALL